MKLRQEEVKSYLNQLSANDRILLEKICSLLEPMMKDLSLQIKWKSLSFHYEGDLAAYDPKSYLRDVMVCQFHRGNLLLVFPNGSKMAGHLGGKNYSDGRKIITLSDLETIEREEKLIKEVTKCCLAALGGNQEKSSK